jgi:hypothetical protein
MRKNMENNPLRQYFRRPSVYLKLPSGGKGYAEDVLEATSTGELPVYPMTAIDEISARTPDALFNGTTVADLIKSCIPSIKDPWKISSDDLDAILIAIRAASGGENLDIESICPSCQEKNNYSVNLMGLLSTVTPGDYDQVLELGNVKIKLKPLTYKDMNAGALKQFELQRYFMEIEAEEDGEKKNQMGIEALEKVTLTTMDLICQTIEYIEIPDERVDNQEFINEFIKNCDRNTFTAIRDFNAELKKNTEIKPVHTKCPSCEHEYDQPITLNPTDFFGEGF